MGLSDLCSRPSVPDLCRKIPVEPGRSVAAPASSSEESEEEEESRSGTSADSELRKSDQNQSNPPAAHLAKKQKKMAESSRPLVDPRVESALVEEVSLGDVQINDFLAVCYDSHWWLGRIEHISEVDVFVKFLSPHGPKMQFHWPQIDDTVWVIEENFICRLKSAPAPRGTRNFIISPDTMDQIEDRYVELFVANN